MSEEKVNQVNPEEYGFTEEDLEGVTLENEQNDDKQANASEEPVDETGASAPSEENTEPNATEETPDEISNLRKALSQERQRRKAAEERMRIAQPVQIPQEQIADLKAFAKQEAMRKLDIKPNEIEDLAFTDADRFQQFISEQAVIEYQVRQRYEQQARVQSDNIAFITRIRSMENAAEVFKAAETKLLAMPYNEAMPVIEAYNRIDRAMGTQDDFATLENFVTRVQQETVGKSKTASKLEVAANLPKAGALKGGTVQQKISDEDILKAYEEGRESELPKEIREAYDKYL